jgi:Mce-associated membrane protein
MSSSSSTSASTAVIDENVDTESHDSPRMRGRVVGWIRTNTFIRILLVLAIALAVVCGFFWNRTSDRLAEQKDSQATISQAEDIAGKYAVGASTFDARDLEPWRKALQSNVTDQLKGKFDSAVGALTPLLQQLQWSSSSTLIAAKVLRHDGDKYVVQAFVDMKTKSSQFPDGLTSTATYSINLDKSSNWTITDVGGIGAGLPADGNSPAPQDVPAAPAAPAIPGEQPAPAGG